MKTNEQQYNPNDPSIWYNNPKLREKVEKIREEFGEPFLITKTGELLYEHAVVLPAFRGEVQDEG
jgi:hypothetical protein